MFLNPYTIHWQGFGGLQGAGYNYLLSPIYPCWGATLGPLAKG